MIPKKMTDIDIVEFVETVLGVELQDYQKIVLHKIECGEKIKLSLYPKRGTPKWAYDIWEEYRQYQKLGNWKFIKFISVEEVKKK